MHFDSLKIFCDLVDTESFTKAAQINQVTQSAVSQQVGMLENKFKTLLVERSKKNFRLTPEGQVFFDYSKKILQIHDALQNKLQEIQNIVSGDIRVATVYSIGLHDLPPYVKRFMLEHPTVNIHVEYRRANQVYEDVIGNIVDLGLVAYPPPDPKLQIIPLRKEPLVLACHPNNPLAKQKSIRIKMLEGQKFISFQPDMPTRKALDKILKDEGATVQHVMELDNIETVKRAVEIDSGVAIVPAGTIRTEVSSQTLAAVKLTGNYFRQLGVIHKKTKVLSPAMKQFITLLKESI